MVPIVQKCPNMVWNVGFLVNTGFSKSLVCISPTRLGPKTLVITFANKSSQARERGEKGCETHSQHLKKRNGVAMTPRQSGRIITILLTLPETADGP